MPFTLTDDPYLYGLEMSLSNILWWLALFKQQDGNFFWNRKFIHSKHVRDHKFMTSTWKGDGHIGRVFKICHLSTDSFVFKQKIYCSFLKMEGVGRRTWEVTKLWPLNGLKLQPIQSLGAVVSSLTSSHKAGSFWLRR